MIYLQLDSLSSNILVAPNDDDKGLETRFVEPPSMYVFSFFLILYVLMFIYN
jgi:hypothetical protein